MNWNRVGTNGMQSGEYRVGKFAADEGALCTLYGLWHKDDRLGYFSDFDSAQVAAEEHAKANVEHDRRMAASSPGVRVDGPVGPLSE
jgi:predicted DNA-binding WGR domain protein